MTTTGWTGEPPDAERQAMPLAEHLLGMRQRGPGDTLAIAMARGRALEVREEREAAASARDPDEFAAGLIGRGYTPGLLSQLSQQLGDVTAAIQAEHEKLDKRERVAARAQAMLERGQIGALDASRMLDGDFGDEGRVRQLERRAGSLRDQIRQASEAAAPPESRQPDQFASANRAAHELFREVTRARMEAAQAGRSEPRPFASAGLSAAGGTEDTGPDCQICAEGRRMDAARSRDGLAPYAPGAVITSHWQEIAR